MLTHTKKRHAKKIVLTFSGSESQKDRARELMASIGFKDTSGMSPWRESFPEFPDNESGTALSGARYKEGITQRHISEKTGIPQRHISEMENGKRIIGRKIARLLSEALNIDYRFFL